MNCVLFAPVNKICSYFIQPMYKTLILCSLLVILASSLRTEEKHEFFGSLLNSLGGGSNSNTNSNTNSQRNTYPNNQYGNQGQYGGQQGNNQYGNRGQYGGQQQGNNQYGNRGQYGGQQQGNVVPQSQVNKPGFEARAGDPYGRDPQNKKTCFTVPCYEPTGRCSNGGCWKTILYKVPTSTGRPAKFVGYMCGRC